MRIESFMPAKAARISAEQAEVYGARIQKLANANKSIVTPEMVVNDAADERSPLHDFFEWNSHKAALQYRLVQARELLRYIHLKIIRDDETEDSVRAFHHVSDGEGEDETSRYIVASRVFTDEDFTADVIQRALRELRAWQARYRLYRELSEVWAAIETVAPVVEKRVAAKAPRARSRARTDTQARTVAYA